jgi:hypothetical protein
MKLYYIGNKYKHYSYILTKNKLYNGSIIKKSGTNFQYKIYCDDGVVRLFPIDWFLTLEQLRESKIDFILIEKESNKF